MKGNHIFKSGKKISGIKALLMTVAMCVMVFSLIGGSIAWLMTETDPVVNIFTYGDINITLTEKTGERYKMTPGKEIDKDPTLTVLADSEDCWLFVKIEESAVEPLSNYIEYTVDDTVWTALNGVPGVYYRAVDSSEEAQEFGILAGDKVKVKDSVTKQMLESLNDTNYPKLTFTGYAVQRDADIDAIDTAEEAWALIG